MIFNTAQSVGGKVPKDIFVYEKVPGGVTLNHGFQRSKLNMSKCIFLTSEIDSSFYPDITKN